VEDRKFRGGTKRKALSLGPLRTAGKAEGEKRMLAINFAALSALRGEKGERGLNLAGVRVAISGISVSL